MHGGSITLVQLATSRPTPPRWPRTARRFHGRHTHAQTPSDSPHAPLRLTSPRRSRSNAHGTATMARATDRFQLSAMRCNILQKCGLSEFGTFDICSPASVEFNKGRLLTNTMNLRLWHQVCGWGAGGGCQ
jgi:hypothetical protein